MASGNSPLRATVSRPSAGMPAAGVDQDRHAPLVGERHEAAHGGLVEAELLGPRVQLDPARAGVQGARGLRDGVVARVDAAVRPPSCPPDAAAASITKSFASR